MNDQFQEILNDIINCEDKELQRKLVEKFVDFLADNDEISMVTFLYTSGNEQKSVKQMIEEGEREEIIERIISQLDSDKPIKPIEISPQSVMDAMKAYIAGNMTPEQETILKFAKEKIIPELEKRFDKGEIFFHNIAPVICYSMAHIKSNEDIELSISDIVSAFSSFIFMYFLAGTEIGKIDTKFSKINDQRESVILNASSEIAGKFSSLLKNNLGIDISEKINEPFAIVFALLSMIQIILDKADIAKIDPQNIAEYGGFYEAITSYDGFSDENIAHYSSYVDLDKIEEEEDSSYQDDDDYIMNVRDNSKNKSQDASANKIKTFSKKDIREMMKG